MSHLRQATISLALAGALSAAGITPALATTGSAKRPTRQAPATASATANANLGIGGIIDVITKVYGIYEQFAGGGNSAQAATQQIIEAINTARTDIINHIDAVATADVRACAQSAVIDFNDFNALTPDNQQAFALSATNCAARADSLISAVTDKAAKDQLGYAVNTVGPIALMARARAGLTNSGLTSVLADANQTIYNQLPPSCAINAEIEPGSPTVYFANCTTYKGDLASSFWATRALAASHLPAMKDAAGRYISWGAAEKVLPLLTT